MKVSVFSAVAMSVVLSALTLTLAAFAARSFYLEFQDHLYKVKTCRENGGTWISKEAVCSTKKRHKIMV